MMHHCCSGSQGHVMGTCTCGMFHGQTNSYPMLFSMPIQKPYEDDYECDTYPYTPSSSYSSVDCTLSLGTPSTRFTEDEEKRTRHERRSSSSLSNFCWNSSQSKHNPQSQTKSSRGNNGSSNNDPLLARRCANCDTTSTPLWRNGPRGPKSLCNACGIRFKKEERRANAAAATSAAATGGVMESARVYNSHHNNSWYAAHSQSHNEFRFVDDSDRDSENNSGNIPFMSWRLNLADRTSLVHDFTR